MEILKNSNRCDKWITLLVTILIFIVPLHSSNLSIGNIIGKCASVSLIGLSGVYIVISFLAKESTPPKTRKVIAIYGLGMIALCLWGASTGGIAGVKVAVSIGMVTCIAAAFSLMDWEELGKGIIAVDIGIISWLVCMYKDAIFEKINQAYKMNFVYQNSNFLGIIISLFIMILIVAYSQKNAKRYLVYIFLLIPILLYSRCRSALISIFVLVIMYTIWSISKRFKATHWGIMIVVLLGIALITYIYPILQDFKGFKEFNKQLMKETHKGFFSGRERVWLDAIDFIKQRPLFGYGLQITLQSLNKGDLTTHNEYLQLILQGGILALGVALNLICMIWNQLYQLKDKEVVRVGASCCIAILCIALFENTLLGESIPLGVIQWGIIGVVLSEISKYNKQTWEEEDKDVEHVI